MSADLKFSFQDNGESFLIHGHAYAALIVKIKTTWVFVVFLCWWFIVKIRTFGFTTKQCSMDNKITSVFHLKSTDLKYKWSCLYTSTNNKMSILNFTKIFFCRCLRLLKCSIQRTQNLILSNQKTLTWILIIFHNILQVHVNQNQPSVLQQNQSRDYLFGAESVNNSVL